MPISLRAIEAKRKLDTFLTRGKKSTELYKPAAWQILDRGYDDPDRAYHMWAHIMDLLDKNEQFKNLAVRPDLIAHALVWHDSVYQTQHSDGSPRPDTCNVKDSAELFMNYALMPALDKRAVYALIMATSNHFDPPPAAPFYRGFFGDRDLMIDYDLSPLAAAPAVFDHAGDQIRYEKRKVPAQDFFAKRADALSSFASQETLFRTPILRKLWDDAARANLNRGARHYASLAKPNPRPKIRPREFA